MYQIFNYRKRRIKTEYIIICHAIDLKKKGLYIDPIVIQGSYKYTWGIWQNYWIRNIDKYALPCHYFCELLDSDYVIYSGLPQFKPSYYIEDLIDNGIIDYRFKNSVLIVIGENFNIEPPEQRMFDHLCDKLLSRLIRDYNLDWSRVKTLDECFSVGWKEQLKLSECGWEILPMKYFDKLNLKMSYNKYCNF